MGGNQTLFICASGHNSVSPAPVLVIRVRTRATCMICIFSIERGRREAHESPLVERDLIDRQGLSLTPFLSRMGWPCGDVFNIVAQLPQAVPSYLELS